MKRLLLLPICFSYIMPSMVAQESIVLNDKDYEITTLIDRDLGPGVRYTRLRIANYPLNVNMLRIDVTNQYNSVEVTQASDKLYSTELLVNAAKRQSTPGHTALAGANANFWCVSGQPPYSDQMVGVTYNGNLKNGKVITETNSKADQYNGGLKHTGITGISTDNKVYSSNNFSWEGWVSNDKIGELEIMQCNKIVRDGEIGLYNTFYPATRTFRCCDMYTGDDGKNHFEVIQNCATEVYLTMDQDQKWSAGDPMTFTVVKVNPNAGNGTIDGYDLALVGRGSNAESLAKLQQGDKVDVRYNWIAPDGTKVKMNNLVGGNAQVMVDGELTKYNTSESYNSQVYSRTGYGTDSDGKTLYIIVIDKATDPVYGTSAGCSTTVMCQIAQHYGCTSMTNFDAGGSAEMLVGDQIINKTTEGSPRAVANGMLAYSIAPEDNTVARLEFYEYSLRVPMYTTSSPRVIAYNKYGAVISDDFHGYTLSCPEEAGTCEDDRYTSCGHGITSTLTATCGNISVTKPVTVVESMPAFRINPILIDLHREYPIEVTANVDGYDYTYDPASIQWTTGTEGIVSIDAQGVLRGTAEGTTSLTARIGTLVDNNSVTVEEANAPALPLDKAVIEPSEWNITYSATKNGTLTALGNESGMHLEYTISSTRNSKVTLNKEIRLYSLPDALEFDINPSNSKINSITMRLQPANVARYVDYTFTPDLTEGNTNTVKVDLTNFGDPTDLAFYPLTFKSMAFTVGGTTGNYSLDIPAMRAIYNNYTDAVNNISADTVNPDAPTAVYNLEGIQMDADNLAPGLYIKVAGGKASKIIVY